MDSLRPFRAGYWFGGFNGLTWMIALGVPMVLLIEQLGGSSAQVGLATSFVFVLHPLQILATSLLRRLGYRRQMVLSWSARALFLTVPLAIAVQGRDPAPAWMANAMVASLFFFCAIRAVGVAAHIPWFSSILPDAARGRYWATDGMVVSAVGVVTLLGCTALFEWLPGYDAFRVSYGLAMVGAVGAVVCLLQLPTGPRPHPVPLRTLWAEARTLALRPGLFRHYLGFAFLAAIVDTSYGSFASYYLKTEGRLESGAILAFTAVTFAGQIAGAFAVRHVADRVAVGRMLRWANAGRALAYAYWLYALVVATPPTPLFAVAFACVGGANGIANTAHMTFLPELAPEEKRPIAIAIFGAITGVLQGLAPMLWGLALRASGEAPGVDLPGFVGFFVVGVATSLLAIVLLGRLPDPRLGAMGARRSSAPAA